MTDILHAALAGDTPAEKPAEQPGDPYHFRVGDTHIALSFDESGPTLEEAVTRYFTGLKQGALP